MWTSPRRRVATGRRTKDAAEDPAVSNATNAYFSSAPVGKIFGDIAGEMKIPPIGLYDTQIQKAFTTQLTNSRPRGPRPAVRSQTR